MIILLAHLFVMGRLEGWYYFEEKGKSLDFEEAKEALLVKQERYKDHLAIALMEPTRENIAQYIEEHDRASKESLQFAETWADIQQEGRLDPALSKRYFLLLSFHGSPLEAAKIAKEFGRKNKWTIKGLSLDGQGLDGLDCEIDRGLGQLLPPSFYAIDLMQNEAILLGPDFSSVHELEESVIERCSL